jgi:hypothetical protein
MHVRYLSHKQNCVADDGYTLHHGLRSRIEAVNILKPIVEVSTSLHHQSMGSLCLKAQISHFRALKSLTDRLSALARQRSTTTRRMEESWVDPDLASRRRALSTRKSLEYDNIGPGRNN